MSEHDSKNHREHEMFLHIGKVSVRKSHFTFISLNQFHFFVVHILQELHNVVFSQYDLYI